MKYVLSGMRWGEKVILDRSKEVDRVVPFDYKQNYFIKFKRFKKYSKKDKL